MSGKVSGRLPTSSVPNGPKPKTKTKDEFKCGCCGRGYNRQTSNFPYMQSPIYEGNNHFGWMCYDCINKRYDDLVISLGDEKSACRTMCMNMDMYYSPVLFEGTLKVAASKPRMAAYCGIAALRQYQGKTYVDTIKEELTTVNSIAEDGPSDKEVSWKESDKRNMSYVLSTIGYDPFEDCGMTEADRKYCFNILAGYCDIDGLAEDGHKVQSVIQITQSQLQCKKLDENINRELFSDHMNSDNVKVWTETKKRLLDSITKIAQDNNISSAYNSSSKQGVNTLTSKMKEMIQIGFHDAEVNMFDIKTSDAMRQIADLSNSSIMEQLALDSNDYTDMLKDQRELLLETQAVADQLKEENRKMKNILLEKGLM